VGFLWFQDRSLTDEETTIDSVAVLPFLNTSGDSEDDYLGDGIAASISSSLTQLTDLRVIPSSALSRYRGQEAGDPQRVASDLGVRAVVIGNLLQRAETLAVRVELVDGQQNRLVWGEQYTRQFADIFEVQEEIAKQIVEAVRVKLTEQEQLQLTAHYPKNIRAYEAYMKGEGQWWRTHGGDWDKAAEYWELAIKEDPKYAQPYVRLSEYYLFQYLNGWGPEEYLQRARDLVEEAIKLESTLGEAHAVLGRFLAIVDRSWPAAKKEFQRAKEVDPDFPPYAYADYLNMVGRYEEATAEIKKISEISDPLSPGQQHIVGMRFYCARRFDLAIAAHRRALELSSKGFYIIPWSYLAMGMEEEAFRSFMHHKEGVSEKELEAYRQAFRESGMRGVYQKHLEHNEEEHLYYRAGYYAIAGDADSAFELLEKCYESPTFRVFASDARFDSLRGDPRYVALLRKLKLPEDAIARHMDVK
jgi:serine/threonine-protein kinase